MRLLDQVAQSHIPLVVRQSGGQVFQLPCGRDFAATLAMVPLRLVLNDELTKTCVALAYSDGERLANCLDLVHVPAQQLWVEWNEAPRRLELARCFPEWPAQLSIDQSHRAGLLIQCDPNSKGRRGTLRTFWSAPGTAEEPTVAPLETHFDFDTSLPQPGCVEAVFEGGYAAVFDGGCRGRDDLLCCVRFRFTREWLEYYRVATNNSAAREAVLRACVETVATDMPLLIALCLLMNSRQGLPKVGTDLSRLNRARGKAGKLALLDHVELKAPIFAPCAAERADSDLAMERQGPRLHHVRGHLVRRSSQLYWRSPHLRGHLALGRITSRTVELNAGGAGERSAFHSV